MRDGYLALKRNGIWSLLTLPPNTKPIACKWVFKVKENMDGTIHKYKARLVAKGFHQVAGFDFTETVSHVVKPTSIIIVLIVAITNGWNRTKLDVNNVFLNGDLKEDLYMMQPSGFETPQASNRVCKHHKALHGLKQSPRAWFDKLYGALISFGFTSAWSNQSLFVKINSQCTIYLLVLQMISSSLEMINLLSVYLFRILTESLP